VEFHNDVIRSGYDAERHDWLKSQGIRVLYFENRTILELLDYVIGVIKSEIFEPTTPALRATPPGQEGR
jgi:very-short-patch-repair endonuclease